MKQIFSFFFILLAAIAMPQRSVAQGSLTIDEVTVIPGGVTTIEVKYAANGFETKALQFSIEIPEGLSFVEDNWSLGPVVPDKDFFMGNHNIFREGTCICFSIANPSDNKNIPDGVVLTFDVACDQDLAWEENTLKVFDLVNVVADPSEVPVVRGTAFTLEKGMFLRIKADDSHYLLMPDEVEDYLTFNGTGSEYGSIFYWDGSKLLAYSNGQYVKVDGEDLMASADEEDNVEFTITQGGNKFVVSYKGINRKKTYTEYVVFDEDKELTSSRKEDDATPLTFEPLEALPVTTNGSGYATLYSPVTLTLPDGVKAYTGALNEKGTTLYLTETDIVPAACGVVIEAEDFGAHTFDFPLSEEEAAPVGDLTGTYATIKAEAVENPYTLQSVDDVIGFYSYKGTNLRGFKAYLTKAASESVRMIKEEPSTGISEIIPNATENTEIYDLQGRRIMTKVHDSGLYISDGKKIVK